MILVYIYEIHYNETFGKVLKIQNEGYVKQQGYIIKFK